MNERVIFTEENHRYIGEKSKLRYESVSGLNKLILAPDIDWDSILSRKAAKMGITPEELQAQWDEKKLQGTLAGSSAHLREEELFYREPYYEWKGERYEVIKCHVEGDLKYQTIGLDAGKVYPECILSLVKDHIRLAGQSDALFVDKGGYVIIHDFKTDKELSFQGFKPWRGKEQCMKPPFDNIGDCNMHHYSQKLGTYMFMALQANPHLKAGKIILEHIPIERDDEGLPVWGADGTPTIKSRTEYEIDYKN